MKKTNSILIPKHCPFNKGIIFRRMGFQYCSLTGTKYTARSCGSLQSMHYKKCKIYIAHMKEKLK